MIRNYDNEYWEKELGEKQEARFYRTEKKEIKYEGCYNNSYSSKIFARARTNSLQLEKQKSKRFKNYDPICKLCGEEEEDIVHFTMICKKLEKRRENPTINKDIVDPEERMKDLLFRNNNYAETRKVIRDLWVLRNQMIKELEKLNKTRKTGQNHEGETDKNSLQDEPVRNQDKDPPIGNPPKSGLLESRIVVIDLKDKPRVQPLEQVEVSTLKKEEKNSKFENLTRSEPIQGKPKQEKPTIHLRTIHQSGHWECSTR